eukprot:COSAG06_NODE_1450_length_9437_cov_5.045299_13_plen_34_part_00
MVKMSTLCTVATVVDYENNARRIIKLVLTVLCC